LIFERDRQRAPQGSFHELKFEELEEKPRETLQLIYGRLGLSGFEQFWQKAESYLESVSHYRKNFYRLDEKSKQKVQQRWGRNFKRYGYSE
jgi:hypothetical protein